MLGVVLLQPKNTKPNDKTTIRQPFRLVFAKMVPRGGDPCMHARGGRIARGASVVVMSPELLKTGP